MAKKYIVDLSEDEVSQLQTLIKKGKHLCRAITRAHISYIPNCLTSAKFLWWTTSFHLLFSSPGGRQHLPH